MRNSKSGPLLGAAALLLLASVAIAANGSFDLSWWTVDGGGGTSSGGDYSLTGTAGQAQVGALMKEARTSSPVACGALAGKRGTTSIYRSQCGLGHSQRRGPSAERASESSAVPLLSLAQIPGFGSCDWQVNAVQ
jgi:hypothetical protein